MLLPIFRSNYSLTSILTLECHSKKEERNLNSPDSIFDICLDYGIQDTFIVDKTLTGLIEAYENSRKAGLNLRFGYRVTVCQDLNNTKPDSELTESKFIIFATKSSFADLIKLHNISTTSGLHNGEPRLDFKCLKENWSKNLALAVPFYDSYLYYNLLYGRQCVPDINFTELTYLIENNGLPFDDLLSNHLINTVKDQEIVPSKTIYYKNRKDFKSYMTYRCILNRSTFQKPELRHFGSQEFCMEAWEENAR
jgi:DNA polymerase III alpha subunit